MKKFGITLAMCMFLGATATMAQDKKADEGTATTKTEVSAEKHECKPGCTMACCAGKSAAEKKSCEHADKAKCAAHSAEATKEEKEGTKNP